jgi:DNA-directed RNA polymerase specialized sigma24 family protein
MNNGIRPSDQERRDVTALYLDQQDRVRYLVARALRPADQQLAEDLAQDVWVTYWQYILRGNTVDTPAALLATMARRRVCDHYRSARVRREGITDFSDDVQARRLPAAPAAEDVAVANLTFADALRTVVADAIEAAAFADWTGADFDSCQVLASIGADDPAGRVTRARAARPVRRAVRTALRTFRHAVRTGVAA